MPFSLYILDANVFIESKNRYYAFDICPGFWDFLVDVFEASRAISIKHVHDEIKVGEDDLSEWMETSLYKPHKDSFKDCLADPDVISAYIEVAAYVRNEYAQNVAADFLQEAVADPWLVAYAKTHGGCVVTLERPQPRKRKASLVDVCDRFGVHHIDLIGFLRAEKARFVYSKE